MVLLLEFLAWTNRRATTFAVSIKIAVFVNNRCQSMLRLGLVLNRFFLVILSLSDCKVFVLFVIYMGR